MRVYIKVAPSLVDKDQYREKAKVARICQKKRRKARAKENIRCTSRGLPGKRRRAGQHTRWKNSWKMYTESVGLEEKYILVRAKWKRYVKNHSGNQYDGESLRRRRRISMCHTIYQPSSTSNRTACCYI